LSKLSVHQRKARDFIQREDWGNALVELERMLGADAQNPTLHNQIGDVYLRKDEIGRACEHFERAIDLYAIVGLHNNAVALCKKIQRLRPARVEVRYRLAKLRLEQGFRSDAAASFQEYLEHVGQTGASPEELEQRCREIVELMPDEAPIGLVLEQLEGAQRFVAAFEIVRGLAQRAADAGDDAAAKRYGEKMRSLRVLVERSGGRDLLAEPQVQAPSGEAATVAAAQIAPASPDTTRRDGGRAHYEPRVLDLGVASGPPVALQPQPQPQPEVVPSLPPPVPVPAQEPESTPPLDAPLGLAALLDAPAVEADAGAELDVAPALDLGVTPTPVVTPDVNAEPGDELPFIGGGFEVFDSEPEDEPEGVAAAAAERDGDDAAVFDPLAFDAPASIDTELHFSDLAAALGGNEAASALPPSTPSARPAAPPPPAEVADDLVATPWAGLDAESLAAPEAARSAPSASTTRWVDELRRSPVWIPTGDVISGPDPSRPDRGLSMELESVIDSFREQMSRALDGDGQARYDLGVAYYDMGLYNEALAEFEAAAASPGLEVQSYEMLAQCLLQTGRNGEVVELLLPVVAADGHALRGALGLHYCLGLAYEAIGDFDQARHCFEEVALVDVDFKDVQSRLQRT